MTVNVLQKSENLNAAELSLADLDQATGGRHHHHAAPDPVVCGVVVGLLVAGMLVAAFA